MASELANRLRALRIMDEMGSDNPLGRDAADALDRLEADKAELVKFARVVTESAYVSSSIRAAAHTLLAKHGGPR